MTEIKADFQPLSHGACGFGERWRSFGFEGCQEQKSGALYEYFGLFCVFH